jgi:hypothetical protein
MLTSNLKNEVMTDIYGKILRSKKMFKLNFSEDFLNSLAPKMREKRYGKKS